MRTALIGAGYWGPIIGRSIAKITDLSYICDINYIRAEQVSQKLGGIPTTKMSEIVDKIDAAIIATPPSTHRSLGEICIYNGIHILVEKPLADTVSEAENMYSMAMNSDVTCMVGHTFLYSPAIRMIKDIIRAGEIGDMITIYSYRLNLGKYQHCGVMWDLLPHDVSICNYLLDDIPVAAKSLVASICHGYTDNATTIFEYPHQKSSIITTSWLFPRKYRTIIVVGTKGMVEWDMQNTYLSLYKDRYFDGSKHYQGVEHKIFIQDHSEPLMNEVTEFVESIRANRTPFTTFKDGLEVVKAIDMAKRCQCK